MTSTVSTVDQQTNKQPLLTISIVTYNPNFIELENTLKSLKIALNGFSNGSFSVTIIDNSASNRVTSFLKRNFEDFPIKLICGQGNIGFGRAHNLVNKEMGEFHLILNPDIQLAPDALMNALAFMQKNDSCGLLSPQASWPDGQRQYLCKRYPAVFDLMLRGFAPARIRGLFSSRLARYEMQAQTQDEVYWNPPIVSGCFMLFRARILMDLHGFNNDFFLYFEDFDISLRSRKFANTVYVPGVKVIHLGGHASKKGFWHIKIFIRSAITFYRIHGIKVC